jgi:hypothetical protein
MGLGNHYQQCVCLCVPSTILHRPMLIISMHSQTQKETGEMFELPRLAYTHTIGLKRLIQIKACEHNLFLQKSVRLFIKTLTVMQIHLKLTAEK